MRKMFYLIAGLIILLTLYLSYSAYQDGRTIERLENKVETLEESNKELKQDKEELEVDYSSVRDRLWSVQNYIEKHEN
jgi:cell division protein FtsL